MKNAPRSSPSDYYVPTQSARSELEIKKSRFIACAFKAQTRAQAMQALGETKTEFCDARHHCWAYLLGDPRQPAGLAFSDDGEPGGTAGRPILNVLEHKNIGDVFIVVVRYFGGVKLGAGGLVRAYSSAAQSVMENVATETKIFLTELIVSGDFALEQPLRHWLSSRDGEIADLEYSERIKIHLKVRHADLQALEAFVLANGGECLPWHK